MVFIIRRTLIRACATLLFIIPSCINSLSGFRSYSSRRYSMLEPFFYCSSLTDINTICIRLMLVVNNAIVIFIFKCRLSVARRIFLKLQNKRQGLKTLSCLYFIFGPGGVRTHDQGIMSPLLYR